MELVRALPPVKGFTVCEIVNGEGCEDGMAGNGKIYSLYSGLRDDAHWGGDARAWNLERPQHAGVHSPETIMSATNDGEVG